MTKIKNTPSKATKQPLFKPVPIVSAFIVAAATIVLALYISNRPIFNQANEPTKPEQSATVLRINESLQQNGATQVCSVGNENPGGLTPSSTGIVYEINKNLSDTEALIKKVAADGGYGSLTHSTNGSADFYEGSNNTAKIGFVVYGDREYTSGCDPVPDAGPNQTAFVLSATN